MSNYFEERKRFQLDREEYYYEKTNVRLKYAAFISIGISLILMLVMIFGLVDFDNITVLLFMRGCAGLFALIFIVLAGILVYRVNTAYFEDKANSKRKL